MKRWMYIAAGAAAIGLAGWGGHSFVQADPYDHVQWEYRWVNEGVGPDIGDVNRALDAQGAEGLEAVNATIEKIYRPDHTSYSKINALFKRPHR